jgi:hypothetical protein
LSIIKPANLALRFTLELCALAALGYWGFQAGGSAPVKILLGIGAPLIAAVIWGTFVSPKAQVKIPDFGRLLFELLVFGSAILALYAAEQPTLALIFAALILLHLPLTFLFNQRGM